MNDEQLADYIVQQISAQYGAGFLFEKTGEIRRAHFCYGKSAAMIEMFDKLNLAKRRPDFLIVVNQLKAQYGMEAK